MFKVNTQFSLTYPDKDNDLVCNSVRMNIDYTEYVDQLIKDEILSHRTISCFLEEDPDTLKHSSTAVIRETYSRKHELYISLSFTLKHYSLGMDGTEGVEGSITISVPKVAIANVIMEGTQFTTFYFYTKRVERILKAVRGKLIENLMINKWNNYLENKQWK